MLARRALRSARSVGGPVKSAGLAAKVWEIDVQDPYCETNRDKIQRASTSSASSTVAGTSDNASSSFRLTAAGTATTAAAIGAMVWYYHLFGNELHAMTPQEEG